MDDETIQWIDQPIPVFFTGLSTFAFVFGLFFTAFCTIILLDCMLYPPPMTLRPPLPWTFTILSPFLLLGLFLLSIPLLMWREAKQTVYAITNLRVIVVRGTYSGFNVTNFYPANFVDMFCKQKADGTGNIFFRNGVWDWLEPTKRGFVNIRNVVKVERMLQELKRTKSPE